VRINRNATAVVTDRHGIISVQFNLDPVGMACDGLVHGVIKHLCHKVVQRAFIRAADIHARAFAHGFQTL